MKPVIKIFIILLLTNVLFWSCKEKQSYPIIPQLEYQGFTKMVHPDGFDTLGILYIGYTDGDGDLGISSYDTVSYNLFVSYYLMNMGVLEPGLIYNNTTGNYDTINFNNRFQQLAPDGYSSWIKGEIEDTINPLFDPRSEKERDTIQFKVYVVDRAGHVSNTIETPLIVVENP